MGVGESEEEEIMPSFGLFLDYYLTGCEFCKCS